MRRIITFICVQGVWDTVALSSLTTFQAFLLQYDIIQISYINRYSLRLDNNLLSNVGIGFIEVSHLFADKPNISLRGNKKCKCVNPK